MRHPRGQAALILILVMMVTSTVALTVIQRSIQEIELTATEVESSKALQAAEAGIEEGLRTLSSGQQQDLEGASYQIQVDTQGANGYLAAADLAQGNTIQIDLQGSPSPPTSLDIYWGDTEDGQESPTGAVEIIKYQQFGPADYRVVHYTFDPDAARQATNGYQPAVTNPGTAMGVNFAAKANIPIVAEDVLVRIRTVYNRALIAVLPLPGGTQLPSQQQRIVSTGETASGIVRKVEVVRDEPGLPQFFDFALFAGSDLSKETTPLPTPPAPTPTPTPYSNPWPPKISVLYPTTVDTARATLSWDSVPVATWYQVRVWRLSSPATPVYDQWLDAASVGCATHPSICTVTPAVNLTADNYGYQVRAWGNGYYNENSTTIWSDAQAFSVPTPPRVSIFGATNVAFGYATLNWTSVDHASWYRIVVGHKDVSNNYVVEFGNAAGDGTCSPSGSTNCGWFSESSLGCATSGTSCSLQVPAAYDANTAGLPADNDYTYWVQAYGPSGFNENNSGLYSKAPDFNVPLPGTVTSVQSATANAGVVTLRFTATNDTTWYRIYAGGTSEVYDKSYSASSLGCSTAGSTCTMRVPRADEPTTGGTDCAQNASYLCGGDYNYWLRSWGPSGWGNWTSTRTFNVPFPPRVTQFGATTLSAGQPTIRFTGVSHATWYQVIIGRIVNGAWNSTVYQNWHSAASMGCSSPSTCTLSPAVTLSSGLYNYWIKAWGPPGYNENNNAYLGGPASFTVP